ncbi:MAG TPA: OPT family oligopeptide transporter [candidate division Zixibacteria bacterium]|nr:OPT/YSL family transporter [candidate division Zixibacteria bacterium]MDD4917478.1 OPT/YSL family transporter [candidate division Zixibacteria bacterium]MDM7972307.1 OPT family oligopeptide transporter [candidate division Zixibacteria bacterium]HOD67096.1 OPT family oligopeptide transporter [candidate division Zixibacteria bacterium]HPM36592.1 OPT family oligopeptide transporter [candidate division Zixibacteria bacterium]
MSMDQQPKRSSELGGADASRDAYENYELPIEGFKGTAEEIERQWYERCYVGRGDAIKQLTWRAVIMGSVLGAVLSLTNIYIGLKAGWGFGVAITACILSYAIWTTFYKLKLARTQMTILENNCMQSTASAAGYSTGGTLVSAFAAYILIHNETLSFSLMILWVFFIAVLGVTMAVPMKRQMINVEQLRFPSGIAAAETLRALHATGQKGMRAARALGIAGLLAIVSAFLTDGLRLISARLESLQISALVGRFSSATLGETWIGRTVTFTWDPIFIAAGMFVGMRVAASMLIGSITCWMIFVPWLQGNVTEAAGLTGFRDLVQWSLWAGTACMVTSGILSVLFEWRAALRAFRGLGGMLAKRSGQALDAVAAIETPGSWFLIGQAVALVALALLAHKTFGMPYWQSFIAVLLSFALALVACRVTGETDTTPVGAMGKITQLTFGALSPGNMDVNLMSANITAGAATSSADLLTDLKSGYLLGAHPRRQFLAQFAGIFIGTLVTVAAFRMLVPNAGVLGTDQFPAPAAQTWRGVAEAMAKGLSTMHPVKIWCIVIGGLVGIILPILSRVFPKHQKWIPSAAGVGLAWVFQWFYGLLFFLGAVIGWAWQKKNAKNCEEYLFPVASGVVAGGALMGVVLVFWENGAEIIKQIFS